MVAKALAEMSGTFAIIFVGISSVMLSEKYSHPFPPHGREATEDAKDEFREVRDMIHEKSGKKSS